MPENITVHGSPQKSVFGLVGSTVSTDEGKFYVKTGDNSKNVGWKQVVIPPTPSITLTPTPTKTVFPARSPRISPTPTQTPTPSSSPPLPTSLPVTVNYTITSTTGGTAVRVDGASPTGTVPFGTGQMLVRAASSAGYYFNGWTVPSSVAVERNYSQEALLTGFASRESVTITANFVEGTLEEKKVNAIASIDGRLRFYYRNLYGFEQLYTRSGLSGGQSFTPLDDICAVQITEEILGSATLSSTPCNLPPPSPAPTGTPFPSPTQTPSSTPASTPAEFTLQTVEGTSFSNCSETNAAIIGVTVVGDVTVRMTLSYERIAGSPPDTRPVYTIGSSPWGGVTQTSGTGAVVSPINLSNNTFTFGAYSDDTIGFRLNLNLTQIGGTGKMVAASYRGRTKATSPAYNLSTNIQNTTGRYKYNVRDMRYPGSDYPGPASVSGNSGAISPLYGSSSDTITLVEFTGLNNSFSNAILNPDLSCETAATPTPTPTPTSTLPETTPTPTPTPTSTQPCILYQFTGLIGEDVTVPCCNGTNPTNFVLPGDIYCCRSAPLTGTWAPVDPITLCAGCFQS